MDKQRILIVEDDLDLSEMLDAYFRVQNYDVLTAAWGEEAVKIAGAETVNLILLDIRLPDINGYEVCRQLRTQRKTKDVPIIFLTEKRDRVDKLQGLELGVVDYITKPFDIQELRLRVRNAISRAERQAMVNPVTELPESALLDERLTALIFSDTKWAVLSFAMQGLDKLRDVYGFVAADEVLRAITLMIRNAVREFGSEDDLIAHLAQETWAIVTTADKVSAIRERIETRIRPSIQHFYPPKAHETQETDLLQFTTRIADHTMTFKDVEALRTHLETSETKTKA